MLINSLARGEILPRFEACTIHRFRRTLDIKPGQVRLGAHDDYGTITFLYQDDVGGLDLKRPGVGFVPATPVPGTLVVNTCCLLQRLTADRFIAAEHRVLIPEEEIRRRKYRQSIVFFTNPDSEFEVKCLNGSDKYGPIKSIDYIRYRVLKGYVKYWTCIAA